MSETPTGQQDIRFLLFAGAWRLLSCMVHTSAVEHGFWDQPEGQTRNVGEMIALIHSELSEGLEGVRRGNPPSDHIPEFDALSEELADVIIRVMDMGEGLKLRIPEAVAAKIGFNKTREKLHGKNF